MPDIKVVKIEQKNSEKYGNTKVLHLEDGSKWNVRDSKPFYESVVGPGIYYAEFKEFQGKEYISFLRFKSALEASNQAATGFSGNSGTSTAGNTYEATAKARLNADKKRQDDIRLEFYCGVAKDILIANKKDGVDINYNDVIGIGSDLYKKHVEMLRLMQEEEIGKTKMPEEYMLSANEKAAKAAAEARRLEEESDSF